MSRKRAVPILCGLVLLAGSGIAPVRGDEQTLAQEILKKTETKGGFIVHLGVGDGKLTAALRASPSYQVHGLAVDPANVTRARQQIRALGSYGPVSVDRLQGKELPYIDNLANLVVAEDLGDVPMSEVMRVLVPEGSAYIKKEGKWVHTIKPRSRAIDEWTHYLHDSTGNPVAHDEVVGPPRHLQWVGTPRWSRHHDRMASMSALVSTGGRVFYIMDEGSRASIELPAHWRLVARDAFNGVVLWKRVIPVWHSHLWPLKSGPTQLARRLVAVKDEVYVTLGLEAPLTAVDAATGKTLRTYEGTKGTEEIIYSDGQLFVLVNKGPSPLGAFAPGQSVGDQQRVAREWEWNKKPREILAIEASTGKVLWRKESIVAPLSLCANQLGVFFHDGKRLVCLNRDSGKEVWGKEAGTREGRITYNFGPRVALYRDVVLFAGGDRKMHAFQARTGKELWSADHDQGAYASPEDLLIAGGLVWCAPTTRTSDSGVYTGRNPLTGKVAKQFPPDVTTYWFHHRCHIAKATDKYLLPSRTGIEVVDFDKEHWDINHWVRGGCLYGIMPCNGLIYTPPHDCACYAEAKLFGFNALAPASARRKIDKVAEVGRLEKGPAFGKEIAGAAGPQDWPTYRHDAARTGYTRTKVAAEVKKNWEATLGGKLSSVVVAEGKLFVAQVDTHTLHALDADSGKVVWTYQAGGRIDSPPTIYKGRALFGSADGWVYCVRASDGELIWRWRAAPKDLRLMAYEQLESVWPVHGTILVANDVASFVAGRSNFLDGGLHLYRLDLMGHKLSETIIDEKDPETNKNIQDRVEVLQMPVGLPDILSSDGKWMYLKSQRFTLDGKRLELGPHSGQAPQQGFVQRGEGIHLFAPMGFLDDTWFHRSYWVYGRSFAGGHNGYYQAGKYAPAGRILVVDEDSVYGYGRKPEYYRWTTPLEYHLFATAKEPPEAPAPSGTGRGTNAAIVRFEKSPSLNPANTPLAVEAWIQQERPNGVIVAQGGPENGYALILRGGKPQFVVRCEGTIHAVTGKKKVGKEWVHLVGVLTADKQLQLYVNGKLAGTNKAAAFIAANPAQALEIAGDLGGSVGDYRAPFLFTGTIDEVRIYHGTVTAEEIQARYANPDKAKVSAKLVLSCSFKEGLAQDDSGNKNDGKPQRTRQVRGKVGDALRFSGGGGGRAAGSFVKDRWTQDLPLLVRGMVLTESSRDAGVPGHPGRTLFLVGPPDLMDEETTFTRLTERDQKVQKLLAAQDAALAGKQGAILRAVSTRDGSKLSELRLPALPVWDGLAAANGRLYLSCRDGKVRCLAGK